MAEGLLRKLLRERERHGEIVVESAGTSPFEGALASSSSVLVCEERQIDIRGHAARTVTKRMLERADLILTMERAHRDRIVEIHPQAAEKCFILTDHEGAKDGSRGIPDPIGLSLEDYEETFQRIEAGIEAWMPRILALLEEGTEPTGNRAT